MKPDNVDDYIESAPPAARAMLRELRAVIKSTAPQANERISYGMPTYDQDGRLCHFAAYEKHVAVYALIHADSPMAKEAGPYLDHRSTLHLKIGEPVPAELIRKAIQVRLEANRKGRTA
jgi:uncharacterized protein YdhG (YjbR/CyaY superfamily)